MCLIDEGNVSERFRGIWRTMYLDRGYSVVTRAQEDWQAAFAAAARLACKAKGIEGSYLTFFALGDF
jgi:hypothetical protein